MHDDDAPITVRIPDSGPIVRLPPDELARRRARADQLIAQEEERERAERNRWRGLPDRGA